MTRGSKKGKKAQRSPQKPQQEPGKNDTEQPLDEAAIEKKFRETTLDQSVDSIAQLIVEMGEKGLVGEKSRTAESSGKQAPSGDNDWLRKKMPDMLPHFARVMASSNLAHPKYGEIYRSVFGASMLAGYNHADTQSTKQTAPSNGSDVSKETDATSIESPSPPANAAKAASTPEKKKTTAVATNGKSNTAKSTHTQVITSPVNGKKNHKDSSKSNGQARSSGMSSSNSSLLLDDARKRLHGGSGRQWGPSKFLSYSNSPHKSSEVGDSYTCDHTNLDPKKMQRINELLSQLFASSLRLYMPVAFQGVVENLHEFIIKDRISDCLESGVDPLQLPVLMRAKGVRESIKKELECACEGDLVSIALQLSSENVYDLLLDLAEQHNRDVYNEGAPCACYFSHCMSCLENLIEDHLAFTSRSAEEMANGMARAQEDVAAGVEALFAANQKQMAKKTGHAAKRGDTLLETFSDAWKTLTEVLWETAKTIDPMAGKRVSQAKDALEKSNGIYLWYSVVIREIADAAQESSCKSRPPVFPAIVPDKAGQKSSQGTYDMSQREIERIVRLSEGSQKDPMGLQQLKGVAQHAREKGNLSFEAGRHEQAAAYYTVAINYDKREAIYPLNRAACMIKLGRYVDAERDCSSALIVDIRNPKAWYRRGVSRAKQGKMELARNDFEHTLFLCKDNKTAFDENMRLCTEHIESLARSLGMAKDKVPQLEARQWRHKGKSVAAKTTAASKLGTQGAVATAKTSNGKVGAQANGTKSGEKRTQAAQNGVKKESVSSSSAKISSMEASGSQSTLSNGSGTSVAGPSQCSINPGSGEQPCPIPWTGFYKSGNALSAPASLLDKPIPAATKQTLSRISTQDWDYGLRIIEIFTQTCFVMAFCSLVGQATGEEVEVPIDQRFKSCPLALFRGDEHYKMIMRVGFNLDAIAAKYGKLVGAQDT